ncbi:uncharacterized [Tachysurus ichikawai]
MPFQRLYDTPYPLLTCPSPPPVGKDRGNRTTICPLCPASLFSTCLHFSSSTTPGFVWLHKLSQQLERDGE